MRNFSETALLPVMQQYKVNREEAIRRLRLLDESGVMTSGEDSDRRIRIHNFLSKDSEVLVDMVMFERILKTCMEDNAFVREYSRVSGVNFVKVLERIKENRPLPSTSKSMNKFYLYVREKVFKIVKKELFTI